MSGIIEEAVVAPPNEGGTEITVRRSNLALAGYQRFQTEMGGVGTRAAINRVANIIRADNRIGRSDGSGRFRSSAIGYCERKQLYSYLGAAQNSVDTSAVDVGTWSHYRWQVAGLSEGFLTSAETKVRRTVRGIRLGGAVDGIMSDGTLFEFKSTRDYSFDGRFKPSWEHVLQMQVYMHLLGMPEGHLVYEAMSRQSRAEWLVPYSEEVFDGIIERTARIRSDWEQRGIRPGMHPLCKDGHWMRRGCSFRVVCLTDHLEEPVEQSGRMGTQHMGVDYSTRKVAVALVDGSGRLLAVRSWSRPARETVPLAESVPQIARMFREMVLSTFEDGSMDLSSMATVSVEHPIVGGNGNRQTAIGMAMAAGALVNEASTMFPGLHTDLVHVSTWKKEVCGNGSLDKDQVGEWLRSNHPDLHARTGSDDEVDAVCLALRGMGSVDGRS